MFRIKSHGHFNLLCYTRTGEPPGIPNAINFFLSLISRVVQRPWTRPFPWDATRIINWNPKEDIHFACIVSEWLDLIDSLYHMIFPPSGSDPLDENEAALLNWYGLHENKAWPLVILRAHISALLSGSTTADSSLSAWSISRDDRTYVSSLSEHIKSLFSISKCHGSCLEWFMPLKGHETNGCFRDLFFAIWEVALQSPDEFFTGSHSNNRFLISTFLSMNVDVEKFISLGSLALVFLSFACRFFHIYKVPMLLQEAIVRMFFEDIMLRVSIYFSPSLLLPLSSNLLSITEAIISSCSIEEWYDMGSHIATKCFSLADGEKVYLFNNKNEDVVSCLLASSGLSMHNIADHMIHLYNSQGRSNLFTNIVPSAVEGSLEHSVIWRCWYNAYSSIFSSFNGVQSTQYHPSSLADIAANRFTEEVFKRNPCQESTILLTNCMRPFFHNDHVVPVSLFHRCVNLDHGILYIRWFHEAGRPLMRCRIILESILNGPNLHSADASVEKFYRCRLISLFSLLPFCVSDVSRESTAAVELNSVCEWVLLHFFGVKRIAKSNLDIIVSAGPNRIAEFLWKLIYNILQVRENHIDFRGQKGLFLNIIYFLYNKYVSQIS